jgi:hypothetical protein
MLLEILIKISDHGDPLISKAIHYLGLFGIGGGAVTYTAGKTMELSEQSAVTAMVIEYGGLVTMISAIIFILKNIVDMVLSTLKSRWDRQEQLKRMEDE